MTFEEKVKKLINDSNDIKILNVNSDLNIVEVLLPYESSSINIEIEGETDKERIKSFRKEVNVQLERMIDHLGDCKL